MLKLRCLVIALIFLAAFASDSWGQSQRAPAKGQQDQTQSQEQKAAPDQRGTEQFPLIVQPLPAKKTADITEREKREAEEKTNSDWWTWLLTLLTVVALFGQLAVFIAQAYFLKGTLKATADAAKGAVTQANAIINAERPYVIFKITKPGFFFAQNAIIIPDPDTNGRLHFELINAGRTPATLEEFQQLYPVIEGITDAPAPLDPMKDRGRLLPVGTISTTENPFSEATNLFVEKNVPKFMDMICPRAWENRRIFCQGFVRYYDAFGNHYISGFLAVYSPTHGAWALRGGKQYNYNRQENPRDIPPHPEYPGE